MSRYLREYKHRASPIRAEIMQKRAVDNQTFYQVKLVSPRGGCGQAAWIPHSSRPSRGRLRWDSRDKIHHVAANHAISAHGGDRLIIGDPCISVADRNAEEFEETLGRFRSDTGNDCWNLK